MSLSNITENMLLKKFKMYLNGNVNSIILNMIFSTIEAETIDEKLYEYQYNFYSNLNDSFYKFYLNNKI